VESVSSYAPVAQSDTLSALFAPQALIGTEPARTHPDIIRREAESGTPAPEFGEPLEATARRLVLGAGYALRPKRRGVLWPMTWLAAESLVAPAAAARRLREPVYRSGQGLVGVCDDLSPNLILDAYKRGLYPFCHVGPIKWWSPAERAVLDPRETHIEKNIRRLIRQKKYRVTFDADFAGVIRSCAQPRSGKAPLTWITPKIMRAYWELHKAGHAHSVEVWDGEGALVGGMYGVATGGVFFGESQFSYVRDASKIAVATLHCHLAHWGFALRDAKMLTEHLAHLGFRNMGRDAFLQTLREYAWRPGRVGRWAVDDSLDVAGWSAQG